MKRTKKLEATAYHEAGHAVAAWAHGVRTKHLSILPDDDSEGRHAHVPYFSGMHPDYDNSPRVQRRLENMVLVCLAGPAAQQRFNPHGFRYSHGSHDRREAVDLLNYLVGSKQELQAYYNLIDIRARQFVGSVHRWRLIVGLAEALLDSGEMTGRQVRDTLRDAT